MRRLQQVGWRNKGKVIMVRCPGCNRKVAISRKGHLYEHSCGRGPDGWEMTCSTSGKYFELELLEK